MEQARRAAREQNLRAAITFIRKAREVTPDKLDNRLHTSLWLLEGMLYRLQGAEDRAQSAWRKALAVAGAVTMKHPLHLCDCVLLHSLTQSWDLRIAGDVLTTLAGRHLKNAERTAAQAAFNQTFLTDPAWLTTFNAVLQSDEGRKFAEDYVLCRQPPRELVLRFYRLLFEHYFLVAAPARAWSSSGREPVENERPQAPESIPGHRLAAKATVAAGASPWPSLVTPEHATRVRQIVDQLVTEMSLNPQGEIAHLYAYLRAWNDPSAAKTLFDTSYPYTPALVENMKWLLKQRQGE
jgi:hypothetical protein